MTQVLDAMPKRPADPKFRFRTGLFGKQILQVGHIYQNWDTNTGFDDGPEYVSWRNANRYEAEEFLNIKEK